MQPRALSSDFVGRRAELALFERAIADARRGLPSVVLVSGDAGIGKTTIVSECAARAGADLYLGRSTHIGGETIPLAPLADLLRQIRRSRPDLLSHTSAFAVLHDWSSPRTSNAPGGSSHGGLFAALLDLVGHLAVEAPIVVGIEDLHWADSVTWDLFEFLARNLIDEQVVLVGTYRENDVAARPQQRGRWAELSRLPAARRLHLDGLDRDEVAQRIARLLGAPVPNALIDQVLARGGGNPFFTGELVAAHVSGEAIPLVLSDLVSAEIADLDDRTRLVLGAVAAVGRETSHDLLVDVAGIAEREVESAVRTAVDARLLVVGNDTYRFRHPLLGEVVYADLLPPQRARLHRSVAAALARQPADALRRADRAGELAFHLDLGGDVEAAFTALLAAADAAETVAPAAAFAHLARADELWEAAGASASAANRGHRLWQAAEIATSTVGNDSAVRLARAAFEHGPPPLGAAWGHERLGRYLWATGRLQESAVEFGRAVTMLGADDGATAVPVYAGLAQAEALAARDAEAEHWCEQLFELAPSPVDDPGAWSMARRALGIVRSNQGDPAGAVLLCRAAMAAAPNAQSRALAGLYLCVTLGDAGEYGEELAVAQDSVAEGHLAGMDRGNGCYFDSLAADALVHLGRWSEVQPLLARHPLPDTLPVGRVQLARVRAVLAARRGDAEEALAQLAVAEELPVDGWHAILRDAAAANAHLAMGNWERALRAAERGAAAIGPASLLWAARFAMFATVAEVEITLDRRARREPVDVDAAVARVQDRLDRVRALAGNLPGGLQRDTAAHLAHAAASVTRLDVSDVDAWADAVGRWDALAEPWATAGALVREAEAAAAAGRADRAAVSLRRSHAIAAELGATPLLAEIESVSARTRISIEAPTRVTFDDDSVPRLGLTPREAQVLALVAAGRTNRQIGDELYVSDKTASVHVSNILRKLGVNSRVDAAAVAQRLGVA